MNKKWKKVNKVSSPKTKESPPMFDDDEGMESPRNSKMEAVPHTPETKMVSGHSTPVHNIINKSVDYPEMNYHESPIEPLTQNPPNEVGWDYQRPILKEEQNSSFDITKTPKRTHLLSKKRNSNSPLLYKPLKKKLIEEEEKQSMHTFKSELLALHKKETSKQSKEKHSQENPMESQLVVELDSQPSEESNIYLQVTTNTEESPGSSNVNEINKNVKALLDDSMEEDAMIICSQRVEEREIAAGKVVKTFSKQKNGVNSCTLQTINSDRDMQVKKNKKEISVKQNSNLVIFKSNLDEFKHPSKEIDDSFEDLLAVCSQRVEEKVLGNKKTEIKITPNVNNYQEKSAKVMVNLNAEKKLKKPKVESVEPKKEHIDSFKRITKESNQRKESSTKCESNSLEIPDDSFDEIFEDLPDEDFCKNENNQIIGENVNKSVHSFNNLSISNKSSATTVISLKNNSKIKKVETTSINSYNCINSQASNPIVQNKMTNPKANFGYLSKDYIQKNSSQCSQLSSDSNKSSELRTLKTKSFSDSNFINQNNSTNKYDKSESNLNSMRQKPQSSVVVNKTSRVEENNTWRRTNSTSAISTPAEIERKRQEALMKRAANMKKRSQNSTINRDTQNSVRR